MSTFTSTNPAVIAALREGEAKAEEAHLALNTWQEEVGPIDTYGRSGWYGIETSSLMFPGGTRPDEDWTVPDRSDGSVRPKKTTERGRELGRVSQF